MAALLMVGGYEAFLRIAKPQADIGQDQFATNRIRLENYVDRGAAADAVIVGSSLTARVSADAWPKGWQVLSQAGGNALAGLEVVDRAMPKPRRILIEINTLDTAYKMDDVNAVLGPVRRNTRRWLWFTRSANRPANLLVWSLRPAGAGSGERAGAGFGAQLGRWQRTYDQAPGVPLSSNLARARAIIDALRDAGVVVAFFEMPVDRSLANRARARQVRQSVAKVFPARTYCWLALDDGRPWHTIDGIHLTPGDGRRAASATGSAPCVPGTRS
jgi:hypothetical protein